MPRKPSTDQPQLVWIRPGNHAKEGERLIDKNLRENGRVTGDPSVIVREFPKGIFTVLSADSEWWREELSLHPEWGEPYDDHRGALFGATDDLGKKIR